MGPIEGFAGEQLRDGDAGYDEARALFNAMIDKRPAVIARCTSPDDVAAAIAHARGARLPIAVRAGGHSVAGVSTNDGGVVIDVRPMDAVSVDPDRRVARVGAGVTWADFDRATQAHGLTATGGRVSTTGVAGLTLGGGSGWTERKLGLACDSLVAVEIMTADGRLVRATDQQHPELLWASKGGGGNFGVVCALEFALHPLGPAVFAGLALYDPEHGRTVTRALRDFDTDAPDEAGLAIVYLTAPPEPFVPPEWHGRRMAGIAGLWCGPAAEGEAALRPLIGAAPAIVDLFGELPYCEFQCMIDDPPGNRNFWTADYLGSLPDDAIEAFCAYSERMPASFAQSLLVPWGGAVARGSGATPMANRDAAWVLHPFAVWEGAEQDAEHIAWARESHAVFAPWSTGGTYLNFIGDEGADRVRAAFGPHYERLATVKAEWDPENVFRGNQNIEPSRLATA